MSERRNTPLIAALFDIVYIPLCACTLSVSERDFQHPSHRIMCVYEIKFNPLLYYLNQPGWHPLFARVGQSNIKRAAVLLFVTQASAHAHISSIYTLNTYPLQLYLCDKIIEQDFSDRQAFEIYIYFRLAFARLPACRRKRYIMCAEIYVNLSRYDLIPKSLM